MTAEWRDRDDKLEQDGLTSDFNTTGPRYPTFRNLLECDGFNVKRARGHEWYGWRKIGMREAVDKQILIATASLRSIVPLFLILIACCHLVYN